MKLIRAFFIITILLQSLLSDPITPSFVHDEGISLKVV